MCSWGKLWTRYKKDHKNPTATFEEPEPTTRCQEQKNRALAITKGVGKPAKLLL